MANVEHEHIIREGVETWNKWRKENPSHVPDLKRLHLDSAYLPGINLDRADLSDAMLDGTEFAGASFNGAKLINASLRVADFTNVHFASTAMNNCDLENATLIQCKFEDTNLASANLKGANLKDAEFIKSNLANAKLDHAILSDCILSRIDLSNVQLKSANLTNAVLKSAKLGSANLRDAKLDSAKLEQATLNSACLDHATLDNALLNRATLSNAHLEGTSLNGAVLQEADCTAAVLKGANLKKADLRRTNLSNANLEDADLREAQFDLRTQLPDATVTNCKIDRWGLERMKDYGQLTPGQRMEMDIVDGVAKMRAAYSGFLQWVHVAALIGFVFPYAWFVVEQWSKAKFLSESAADWMPLWKALFLYIWNGGVAWQSGAQLHVSFLAFLFLLGYNVLRGVLLWKTKQLELEQEASGLPVMFSLGDSKLGITFKFATWLFYVNLVVVALNLAHFFTQQIPLFGNPAVMT